MSKPFVHLHNHTEYSLLDGAQRIPEMVSRAKELDMPALAISDHGAMYGAIEFFYECRKQGIKPIIGMEAYVAPQGRQKKSGKEDNSTFHLLLLAKNKIGYRNLCKLATAASLEGYYYKPRVDHEILKECAEGLICTTTCLGSEINRYLLRGDYELAARTAAMYKEIFGEGNYFVELQDHRLPEQAQIKEGLLKIAKELNLPLLCTNDAHYLCKTDHDAHDVLLCIQTNRRVADKERMRFDTEEFYLKSGEEMAELFSDTPEAVENTLMVADMIDFNLEEERAELPDPMIPNGQTPDQYLRNLAEEFLNKEYHGNKDVGKSRIDYELGVVEQTGFSKYFLLVREFAMYAREHGIYFGVRGSAAGSFVSYCVGITDVDPIEYDLTFERFLNPERIQMPDIDMDFEDARRDEVIKYVRQRFGDDHVAQIVTFGTLGAKQAIRDAGRALGRPLGEVDRLCKTLPTLPGFTIKRALEEVSEFKRAYAIDPETKTLVDTAGRIEGIARHAGVHAAGVVISKEPLRERVPLAKGADEQVITQYPMGDLEKIGLLKMDFLGLSNLTVLGRAVESIERAGKGKIDIKNIPLDDRKTFEMLGRGETTGVFQLESDGMRRHIVNLLPNSIQELTAMVALYRPGPIEHIPSYIDGKFQRRNPEYIDPRMEPILRESYGVITYQDQVLQLVRALAGFTLGKADILRRAMGKKDKRLLESMRVEFMQGTAANGISAQNADRIWTLLEPFAGYAFNKAHAVCYALIAYQTAYLKANYPVEYMAALLGAYQGSTGRLVGFFEECRRIGIEIKPPDINRSHIGFSVEENGIRFGLAAIKGIGEAAIECILKARKQAEFTHLFDLAARAREFGSMNKLALEALIKAGSLDSIEPNRNKLLAMVETALAYAENQDKERRSGQVSMFVEEAGAQKRQFPELPPAPPPTSGEQLAMEREVLGVFLSDHPLRSYAQMLEQRANSTAGSIAELEDGATVILGGLITGLKETRTKEKGELMAVIQLEDLTGQATVTIFPRDYANLAGRNLNGEVVFVHGTIKHRPRGIEVISRKIEFVGEGGATAQAAFEEPAPGIIRLKLVRATPDELKTAQDLMRENPGEFEIVIEICKNGNGINGNGKMPSLKSLAVPFKVSDGPWLQRLRATFNGSKLQVERRTTTRS